MKYNFDEVIDRRGTNSLKYDYAVELGKPEAAMPLWVADMDFQIPPEATEALMECVRHAIYGYTITKDDYDRAVINWFADHFGYEGKAQWIVKTPGVVFALAMAVRAYTSENDAVMIQMPVYYPFERVITTNNRKTINNPLVYNNAKYSMDFEDFERKISENNVKIFILCSPHNPVGRVWTRDELSQVEKICKRHGCLIVSDEIHCDITYPKHIHHVFEAADIICTAPSKTFNLAGLQCSNIFIPNEQLRQKFEAEVMKSGYPYLNTLSTLACKVVYEQGGEWLAELRKYLRGNFEFMKGFLTEKIPQIKIIEPEGTYLVWLDFSGFGLANKEMDEILLKRSGVWLSDGAIYGAEGEGFWRMNIACPRSTLRQALEKIESGTALSNF